MDHKVLHTPVWPNFTHSVRLVVTPGLAPPSAALVGWSVLIKPTPHSNKVFQALAYLELPRVEAGVLLPSPAWQEFGVFASWSVDSVPSPDH